MKQNLDSKRASIARAFAGLFAAPYLPAVLIRLGLLLAAASLALVLLGQPLLYWMDRTQATSSLPFLREILKTSPLAFLAAALAYLALAWAVIGLLTRRLALIAWLALAYVHLAHLLTGLAQLLKLSAGDNQQARLVNLCEQALAALLIGLALSLLLLRRRPAVVSSEALVQLPREREAPSGEAGMATTAVTARPKWGLRIWQRVLAVVIILTLAGGGFAAWNASQQSGWQMLKPAHTPGKRTSSAVVYDPREKHVLLFGGASEWLGGKWLMHNDLWVWDGRDWTPIELSDSADQPAVRMNHALAYDEERGVLVLFGGETSSGRPNDTWEWNGSVWKRKFSKKGSSPAGRTGHVLYYDPSLGKVVLSGGFGGLDANKKGIFFNDVWTWDGESWIEVKGATGNPFVTGATGTFDVAEERAVLMNYDGLLGWSEDHWERLTAHPEPPSRKDARMIALPNGGLALFGGAKDDAQLFNDLWIHTTAGWQDPNPPLKPAPRMTHVLFYDPVRSAVVIYGGYNNQQALDDMWEYPLKP